MTSSRVSYGVAAPGYNDAPTAVVIAVFADSCEATMSITECPYQSGATLFPHPNKITSSTPAGALNMSMPLLVDGGIIDLEDLSAPRRKLTN